MSATLTLAGNGCNRGKPGRGNSMGGKCLVIKHNSRAVAGKDKMLMVNAILRKSQTGDQKPETTQDGFMCRTVMGVEQVAYPTSFQSHRPTSTRGISRTGHLSASFLHTHVTAGSPKRVGFTYPAWRRSRH